MTHTPTIRMAEAGDACRLAALAEQTFRATFAAMNAPENMTRYCEAHFSEAVQGREIRDPAIDTLVCEHDGQLVGFAQLRWGPGPDRGGAHLPAEIRRLYVTTEWQGRGVAQELMAALIRLAEAGGADQVWLGVWERNPRAIAFYRKCGFAEAGAQTFLLGADAQRDIVMTRALRP